MSESAPGLPRKTQASRYLFLFLVGLVIGVIGTVMAVRAIEARADHFPGSVMRVQQWHLAQLGNNLKENRCAATDTLPHLRTLRALSDDLEPAFPDLRDDARYVQHASAMRAAVDSALGSPPLNCQGLKATVKNIGDACQACHQDFRS
ncbi:hypothetical protein ACFFGH_07540 [Lysobacter korlensis]|uniref:Cytochrome C n=1 Tax=Lysobacter korlensis TaxID=553636 RepID=A0ABV6RMA5_9GAMM